MVVRTGTSHRTKVTFSLPIELVDAVRQLVREGAASSQSVLVTQALEREVGAHRRAALAAAFRQAASDPEFLRDVQDVASDFIAADSETARMIP